jgi:hypothetical protein
MLPDPVWLFRLDWRARHDVPDDGLALLIPVAPRSQG